MEPSTASQVSKMTPLTDSPWFWLYVFATVGLGLLVLVGPKWIERRVGLDQRAQGMDDGKAPKRWTACEVRLRKSTLHSEPVASTVSSDVGLLGVGISVAGSFFSPNDDVGGGGVEWGDAG